MDLFARIDAARDRWDVLGHPFYTRWSEGALRRGEIGFYAGEYRHAVIALATQSRRAAEEADGESAAELAQHAREEAAHVELWDAFACELGARTDRPPLPETIGCTEAWTAGDGLLDRLAILYAIESAQPAIAQTKQDGLADHYGLASDHPAARYFAVHAHRDHEHAAQARRLIAERPAEEEGERLVALAEGALAGNWRLLDGVEAHLAAEAPAAG